MPELMSKPKLSAVALSVGVLALAGCGSSSNSTSSSASTPAATTPAATTPATTSSSAASSAQVSTKSVSTLGTILVNSEGRTLYIFEPDKHAKVTCVSACASLWPPLKLSSGQKAVAGGEAKSSLLQQ